MARPYSTPRERVWDIAIEQFVATHCGASVYQYHSTVFSHMIPEVCINWKFQFEYRVNLKSEKCEQKVSWVSRNWNCERRRVWPRETIGSHPDSRQAEVTVVMRGLNCISQLERKQAQISLIIILQILTAEQTSARKSCADMQVFHDC